MRKLSLLGLVLLLAISCASKPDLKEWIETPPFEEDIFYGTGEATMLTPVLAKQTATAVARAEIAQAISIKVKALLRFHLEQSGIGTDAEVTSYSEAVSKQIAEVELQNSRVTDTQKFEDKDGLITYWVLVEYPIADARQMAADIAKETLKREEALYNKFSAEQGFDRLDQEVEANLKSSQ